jgi:UrcA family protein
MSYLFKSMIAALALATAATPDAAAEPWVETRSIRVAYDDLDVSNPAGAETLLRRIKTATAKVCGRGPSPKLIRATVHHKACVDAAMSRGVMEANIPLVTAMFTGSFDGKAAAQTAAR